MRPTKYFLHSLVEIGSGEYETVNVMLPMNRPLMFVRVGGVLRVKKLIGSDHPHKTIEPVPAEQVKLL